MSNINSEIRTFRYENGDIQRVQVVEFDSLNQLDFFSPHYDSDSYTHLWHLYRDFIIQKFKELFGQIVIFHLPENEKIPFDMNMEEYGTVYDSLAVVTAVFRKHVHIQNRELVFDQPEVEDYFHYLESNDCLHIVKGKRNSLSFLPVGKQMGFMSKETNNNPLMVNSSFFVMDLWDCGSVFDHTGIPIGLMVKNGKILNPPQFEREVLLKKKESNVEISRVSLEDLTVEIDGVMYRHNKNCTFYSRPDYKKTPEGQCDIVIVNNKVVALNPKGNSPVPCGGFVIGCNELVDITDTKVEYHGLENVEFAIQVGNSCVINGNKTEKFISPFYKFWQFYKTAFPPSMYPSNYKKSRAPRIVLGVNKEQKGMLLWFEGAGKFGYKPGEGSCGATLKECAEIAQKLGMYNGVHLDGGGSAQILLKEKRQLKISDRTPDDYAEVERAIPVGLMIH